MSFILDALKKSESDRQRQSGPALFEVKVAPRRVGLPLWAVAIGALLGINLIIVMWMLLRHPAAHPDAATAASPAPTPATAPAAAQPQAIAVPSPPVANTAGSAAALTVPTPVANAAQAQGLAPAAPATGGSTEVNPEDLAPAAEPVPLLGSHVKRGTADGVPLYQDAAVVPGTHIPTLRLDLHVYAERPEERFVMINMKKLREGDSLPEGVRVESIMPEGVILSYSGSRFMMPSQ
jgi:general secretion pathway protein B